MPDHGTHHVAVYLPDAAYGVELAAAGPRDSRARCEDELSGGGPAPAQNVENGFRTRDPSGRVVEFVVGARQ